MSNRLNYSLWWLCGFFVLKTNQRHDTNTSINSLSLLSLFIFSAGSDICLIKGVKFSKAPKLPQQPQGLSGGIKSLRLGVYMAREYGSANTLHLTLKAEFFSQSRQSPWLSLGFRHLNPLKLLKIISRGIRLEMKWEGVRCTLPLFWLVWQTPCLPTQGLVEWQGRCTVL